MTMVQIILPKYPYVCNCIEIVPKIGIQTIQRLYSGLSWRIIIMEHKIGDEQHSE